VDPCDTTKGWLLINLGMGGELLLVKRGPLAEKHRIAFRFTDGTALTASFWWFGYVHYAAPTGLAKHQMTRVTGSQRHGGRPRRPVGMTRGRARSVKAFLLDQSNLAGIGNAYIHDILFLADCTPEDARHPRSR